MMEHFCRFFPELGIGNPPDINVNTVAYSVVDLRGVATDFGGRF